MLSESSHKSKFTAAPDTAKFIQNAAACRLLWRKRSDDFLKARVAPQRIPERIETQMAVSNMAPWQLHCLSQSFNCAILIARPSINNSQVLNQHRAIDGAFPDRHQLDRALAFAEGILLVSQSSINHSDCAKSRCVVGLFAHDLLKFFSSVGKGVTSCRLITAKPGDKTLAPTVRKGDIFVAAATYRHSCQCMLGGNWIPLA